MYCNIYNNGSNITGREQVLLLAINRKAPLLLKLVKTAQFECSVYLLLLSRRRIISSLEREVGRKSACIVEVKENGWRFLTFHTSCESLPHLHF
jgi:hypothetical protein